MRAQILPRMLMVVLLVAALFGSGCDISMEQDPATSVQVEITGISAEADREAVSEKLKGMTDGSSHSMTSSWSGEKMTVNLSPVSDVQAFADKVDFGKVTDVTDRTVKVQYGE